MDSLHNSHVVGHVPVACVAEQLFLITQVCIIIKKQSVWPPDEHLKSDPRQHDERF